MKKLLAMILILMLVFVGCASTEDPPVVEDPNQGTEQGGTEETPPTDDGQDEVVETPRTAFNIASLKGPTTMGLVNLMSDMEAGETRHDYNVTMYGKADEITGLIATGAVDVALIPSNLAATLYQKPEVNIQVAGINTLGVLYVVDTGDSINTIQDLVGKTVYTTGKGTTPEYSLNYVLSNNGIDPATDLTIEFKSEAAEVAASLTGPDMVAMLPQPFVSTVLASNENARIALDLTEEWEAVATDGSTIVTGVVVVNTDFLAENKAAFDEFMEDYTASVDMTVTDPDGTAALIGGYDIVPEPIAKVALPYCNITMITGAEMQEKLEGYLNALHEQNPAAVGGAMPDEAFYYNK